MGFIILFRGSGLVSLSTGYRSGNKREIVRLILCTREDGTKQDYLTIRTKTHRKDKNIRDLSKPRETGHEAQVATLGTRVTK